MQELDNKVGYMIHKVDIGVKKILEARLKAAGYDEATVMHGWILKYLYDNGSKEIYQKDIEKQFGIGRSTVTTIIQLMEKQDLIRREAVESDARLKKVILTEKGKEYHDLVGATINDINRKVMQGISEEEKQFFLGTFEKIEENLRAAKREITEVNSENK